MKKRLTALLLAIAAALAMTAPAFAAEQKDALELTDIAEEKWYTPAVLFAVSYGVMDPVSEQDGKGIFVPDAPMLREQVADAVYRFAALADQKLAEKLSSTEADQCADFDSVSLDCRAAVRFCYGAGVMTGDKERRLHPQNTISRQEFAAVLQRFVKLYEEKGYMEDVVSADTLAVGSFTDQTEIAAWARPDIAFCRANGLMQGNANGTFNPKGEISRAEMAQVLYNLAPRGV
ncbi:MAG: S-layer homology domain-containing protein [Agathobaculum sp.]|jgi:hypothetical protein|uniref:S-layer homology domain-containing protein n=1 Tax=Agathobaculum sp. TaxID=2048138 RepID=UPI003D90A960